MGLRLLSIKPLICIYVTLSSFFTKLRQIHYLYVLLWQSRFMLTSHYHEALVTMIIFGALVQNRHQAISNDYADLIVTTVRQEHNTVHFLLRDKFHCVVMALDICNLYFLLHNIKLTCSKYFGRSSTRQCLNYWRVSLLTAIMLYAYLAFSGAIILRHAAVLAHWSVAAMRELLGEHFCSHVYRFKWNSIDIKDSLPLIMTFYYQLM